MILEVKDASLNVGGKDIFNGLSFVVESGKVIRVGGENEKYNTLLLHVILGVIPLDKGYVCLDGEVVSEWSAASMRKRMAYVPLTLKSPDEREQGMTEKEMHRKLLERAADNKKDVVLVDGIYDEEELGICTGMAAEGALVVLTRTRRSVELNEIQTEGE